MLIEVAQEELTVCNRPRGQSTDLLLFPRRIASPARETTFRSVSQGSTASEPFGRFVLPTHCALTLSGIICLGKDGLCLNSAVAVSSCRAPSTCSFFGLWLADPCMDTR